MYQALETEIGGVEVYTTAIRCAENEDLKEEWEEYLEQTKKHVTIMEDVLPKLDLDPNEETPGRKWCAPLVKRWSNRWRWLWREVNRVQHSW